MPRIISYPWLGEGTTTATLTCQRADLSTETYTYAGTAHGIASLATYAADMAFLTGATYSPATRRVTLTGVVAFHPTFGGNLGRWFGFTTPPAPGYALSWTGDSEPGCVQECMYLSVEPVQDWARVEFGLQGRGRVRSVVWGNHQVHEVNCTCSAASAAAFRAGWVTTGKVRIVDVDEVTALSAGAPRGYLDGWVVASTDLEQDGDIGELLTFKLWIAVAR